MKTGHILILLCSVALCTGCMKKVTNAKTVDAYPSIYPNYYSVTIPATIAPLNFKVNMPHDLLDVVITAYDGSSIHLQSKEVVDIPVKAWRRLLSKSLNGSVSVAVSCRLDGVWSRYKAFPLYVNADPIDEGVAYRLIAPGYEKWGAMGLYYRDLSSFSQTTIIDNTQAYGRCMNCHTFNRGDADRMVYHIRGTGGATVLVMDGETQLFNTKTDSVKLNCVYPYWHPGGRYIAFSTNATEQLFHMQREKKIEVYDAASDVVVYDTEQNMLLRTPLLSDSTRFETFPAFSADGKTLYFCSSKAVNMPVEVRDARYILCKIDFDPETGTFGDCIETVLDVSDKSISFPRPSYDGRFLCYTLSNYGNFSIWHPEADLHLLDLSTNETRPMTTLNSRNTESFHNWSSNSRWMVFSSRRQDGRYTQLYLAHVDINGTSSRPFLLPQKNPNDNQTDLRSYNVPDFVTSKPRVKIPKTSTLLESGKRGQFKQRP